MIDYDKYDLLELFESEPTMPYEDDVGIYYYKKTDLYGFTFKLYFSAYDQDCCITLRHKDFTYPIFDLGFEEINIIKCNCKENKLVIKQIDKLKNIVIYFKPIYTLVFENIIE